MAASSLLMRWQPSMELTPAQPSLAGRKSCARYARSFALQGRLLQTNEDQTILSTTPPSTRSAAPVVAEAWGEAV